MATLRIQLISDSGAVSKDYQTVGSIQVYERVVRNAICETLGVVPQLVQQDAQTLPKVCDNTQEFTHKVTKIESSKPLKSAKALTSALRGGTLVCDLPRPISIANEEKLEVKKPKLRIMDNDRKGFTIFNCPHCGGTHYGVHTVGEETVCVKCNKTIKVPEGLVYAQYNCPNCGQGAYAFVEKLDKPPVIGCKSCKSPIDIFFNEKKGYYVGAR